MESEQQQKKGTPFLRTCLNATNTLCGVGIVSVPYALSRGGWLGILLLFFVAALCFYTGIILHKCMNTDPNIKTYPDIGQAAFGRKGTITISMFLYVELFLVAVAFLIMEADNLYKLFPTDNVDIFGMKIEGKKGFVMLTALIVLPTTWLKNLGVFAYVSVGGVISPVILVLCVLWGGVFDGIGFHERGELLNYSGLTTTLSMFTFCYCGHSVFPTIRNSMEKKTQFPKVLLVSFILSTISYGLMSILGYMMFGENLTSQVTLNLPIQNISSKIAIYMTLVAPITKYALIIAPIATMVEKTFFSRDRRMRSFLIRTCIVISTLFVALLVPFFGQVMAFIGAFVGIVLSILFPCLCYLKIVTGFRNFRVELILILMIMLSGTFVAVLGTWTALVNIISEARVK